MAGWISRAWREWPVIVGAAVTALFGANDTLDVLTWRELDRWLFLIAFVVFFAMVMQRLVHLQGRLDNRARFDRALVLLSTDIAAGQTILEECGRPREQYAEAPMSFLQTCLPKINAWCAAVVTHLHDNAPEFIGKFQRVGNVTYRTEEKAASIQQLERHLEQLESITDELRRLMNTA